jgi:hypothetical protein
MRRVKTLLILKCYTHGRVSGLYQWYRAGLWAVWPGGSSPAGGWEFFSSPPSSDHLWGLPSLPSNGYRGWGPSLGVKRPGREADHSPPTSAEVKNVWSYTSTLQYAHMAWCSVKAQGQIYLFSFKHRGEMKIHKIHIKGTDLLGNIGTNERTFIHISEK